MALEEYRRKRSFAVTPEPEGGEPSERGLAFVVQKHRASHLHYDFRLELQGVLKSWAVPKGPSVDPSERRLAMRTEDHPMDYRHFEGVIPEGEYGGGTVMVWDRGHWTPEGNPHKGIAAGKLDFVLEGSRLHGKWRLVRTGADGGRESWLLVKRKDRFTEDESESRLVDRAVTSVATGRTMDEIAADRDRLWSSRVGEVPGEGPRRAGASAYARADAEPPDAAGLPGARKAKLPSRPSPMLAQLVDEAPAGDGWIHEMKLDGYRILARVSDGDVRLMTAQGQDWSDRYPPIRNELGRWRGVDALLDGEVVVLLPDGTTSFEALESAGAGASEGLLVYYAFDLLHLGNRDIRSVPLLQRKEALAALLAYARAGTESRVRFSEHVRGRGPEFFEQACSHGLDGIISKRAESRYAAGRSPAWVEARCLRRERDPSEAVRERKGGRSSAPPRVAGVPVTSLDRLVYPEAGLTKRDLFDYYQAVAELMLPHTAERPLTLVRCPDGVPGECFFQKHGGEGTPEIVPRVRVREKEAEGKEPYVFVDRLPALIALVQLGVVEFHVWNSRVSDVESPDQIVFDLDPGEGVSFERVVEAAREVRDRLQALGLVPFLKTTGGKGLHVIAPIEPTHGWDVVAGFAKLLAQRMARSEPERYTAKLSRSKRGGRIFVDYLRNGRNANQVAPFSTRARPAATVSVPLRWDELRPSLDPGRYTVPTVLRRLRSLKEDPWGDFEAGRREITVDMVKALGRA